MTIIKRAETALLYSKFKYKGKQYLRSTGTANLRDAEAWERRFRAELEAKGEQPKGLIPTLAVLRGMDVDRAVGEGRTMSYIRSGIGQHWRWLIEFFPDTRKVTAEGLRAYVRSRQAEGVKGQTIRKELVTLKRGLKLAQVAGHLVDMPLVWPRLANSEPDAKQEGHLIPPDTLHLFLGELKGVPLDMALLALLTGMRKEELLRVEPAWIKRTPGASVPAVLRLPAHATKGRKKREIGLVQAALEIVERTPFPPPDHKTTYRAASRRCGAPQAIKLRDMRHTFATVAADRTGDEMGVALVMGHTSGVMTLRYQTTNVERLGKIALAVWEWFRASAP